MLKSTSTWFSAVGESLVKLVGPKQCRVLLVGAPAGGKTTALYRLKLNETVTTIPTYGVNAEVLNTIEGVEFTVWDFGGSQHSQGLLWHRYVAWTHGIIFVVDSSSDEPQIDEARDRLWRFYEEYGELLQGSVLLVLANKQDRRDAMSVAEHRVLLMGPATSVKTTVVRQLRLGTTIFCITPYGYGYYHSPDPVWGYGGSWFNYRRVWGNHLEEAAGFICAVDSEDESRFEEVGLRLWDLHGQDVTTIPTPVHSFNKETVTLPSKISSSFSSQGMTKYTFYDHSGNLGAIRFWHKFMEEGGPVIFVVDSTDPVLFYEAQEALKMAYLEYEDDNNVQRGIL
ncbi:hypothetical protein BGX24_003889, partial [Mortierella sp. AD032]